jgi:hypothetical protein
MNGERGCGGEGKGIYLRLKNSLGKGMGVLKGVVLEVYDANIDKYFSLYQRYKPFPINPLDYYMSTKKHGQSQMKSSSFAQYDSGIA